MDTRGVCRKHFSDSSAAETTPGHTDHSWLLTFSLSFHCYFFFKGMMGTSWAGSSEDLLVFQGG